MQFILANEQHAEAISDFYHRVHGDSFVHREMLSAVTVAQLLRDAELALVVCHEGPRIIGCGMGLPQQWNHALEIGALSVDQVPERAQIGKALFEALRRLGTTHYGLAVFRASSEAAFQRGRNMGASCWGFWPKPGSKTLADAELLMGFFNPTQDTQRVTPPSNPLTNLPFPARLLRQITEGQQGIAYPKIYPVGAPRGTGAPVLSGRVWPTYHSRGNYITIESTAGPFPTEILREFVGKVRQKGVSDVRLALPVNQHEAYAALCALNFKPVSYLPGWYLRGPYRFDCVELVAGLPPVSTAQGEFVGRAIDKILEGFAIARR